MPSNWLRSNKVGLMRHCIHLLTSFQVASLCISEQKICSCASCRSRVFLVRMPPLNMQIFMAYPSRIGTTADSLISRTNGSNSTLTSLPALFLVTASRARSEARLTRSSSPLYDELSADFPFNVMIKCLNPK